MHLWLVDGEDSSDFMKWHGGEKRGVLNHVEQSWIFGMFSIRFFKVKWEPKVWSFYHWHKPIFQQKLTQCDIFGWRTDDVHYLCADLSTFTGSNTSLEIGFFFPILCQSARPFWGVKITDHWCVESSRL